MARPYCTWKKSPTRFGSTGESTTALWLRYDHRLKAHLLFSEISWGERKTNEQYFNDGGAVRTDKIHRCLIQCSSEVVTDEAMYRSEFEDLEEWPIGWPQPNKSLNRTRR